MTTPIPAGAASPGNVLRAESRQFSGSRRYTDARETDLRRLLLRFHLYQFDPVADFEGAARIYRRCRQAGITPRGLVDCMIAAVARRHEATLLACDIDLDRVAGVIGIDWIDQRALADPARSRGLRLVC